MADDFPRFHERLLKKINNICEIQLTKMMYVHINFPDPQESRMYHIRLFWFWAFLAFISGAISVEHIFLANLKLHYLLHFFIKELY